MRAMLFAKRNIKELLRDPFSYVFTLAMPVVMLCLMYFVFYDPNTAFWFSLDLITPGIMVFSYAFTMLYMTILVSRDKTTAFLTRLFTSPMSQLDFILGYTVPGLIIALLQGLCCAVTGKILALVTGFELSFGGLLLSIVTNLPVIIMYIGFGILFGTVLSDKSAPAVSSPLITAGGMLCGAWMPIETFRTTSKGFYLVCKILPFYPSTVSGRIAAGMNPETQALFEGGGFAYASGDFIYGLIVAAVWALVVYVLAVLAFGKLMRSDKK